MAEARLLCLADDLTGAADVAVQFYNKGVTPTTICLQQQSSDPIELSASVTSSQAQPSHVFVTCNLVGNLLILFPIPLIAPSYNNAKHTKHQNDANVCVDSRAVVLDTDSRNIPVADAERRVDECLKVQEMDREIIFTFL